MLGFAYKKRSDEDEPEEKLLSVMLQELRDPPRESVVGEVADTQQAGIDVKVITGNYPGKSRVIAAQPGVESGMNSGQ